MENGLGTFYVSILYLQMTYKKSSDSSSNFVCTFCDYITVRKSQYVRHLSTAKHQILTNTSEKVPKSSTHICECGNSYKHRQSLNNHKKKCDYVPVKETEKIALTEIKEDIDYKDLLMKAMKAMNQMQEQQEELRRKDELMERMIDKIGTTNNTNNTINNTNNFNINMFLNEQCKDAINFTDFINRIEISHNDLENNAQLGFVEGITKIFVDHLNQLTLYERPIHCTDTKRETLYIKDVNKWEKENSQEKMSGAIQNISRKSLSELMEWKKSNPEYEDMDSEFSKMCINIQTQSVGTANKDKLYPKIINNVARNSKLSK